MNPSRSSSTPISYSIGPWGWISRKPRVNEHMNWGAVEDFLRYKSVTVTDFGALPDSGGTDDREGIQNAIDFVWQNGGGNVYIPWFSGQRLMFWQGKTTARQILWQRFYTFFLSNQT